MAKSSKKQPALRLAAQTLNWNLIKNLEGVRKIYFQFDVSASANGSKRFNLVAYPAYKKSGKWVIGPKIPLDKKPGKLYNIKLPVTLGNLELDGRDLSTLLRSDPKQVLFIPQHYKPNPHVEYMVTDGASQTNLKANPSPPALPLP